VTQFLDGMSRGAALAEGPAGEVMALLKLLGKERYKCFVRMFRDDCTDLVHAMDSIARGSDPYRQEGPHRRALVAMEAFVERDNADVLVSVPKWRAREDMCGDDRCLMYGGAIQDVFFLQYSPPNGLEGRKNAKRHVAVAGVVSLDTRFCSRDAIVLSTTSGDRKTHSTFGLYGRAEKDGQQYGVQLNPHPVLFSAACGFKRAIVHHLASK